MSENNSSTPSFDGTRYTGRVKWFNNRAGFGFVTVLDGPQKGEDVFAHHSGIEVNDVILKVENFRLLNLDGFDQIFIEF